MFATLVKFAALLVFVFGLFTTAYAQPPDFPDASGRPRRDETPVSVKDMLARQRVIQAKKDHEEMIERGEAALKIAKELEASFEQNKTLSPMDRQKLESLENTVEKIRKELGGDDDDERVGAIAAKSEDDPKPSNVEEAFKYLQSTTVKLVDELKKTTRFSISVIAIQTSNNVLKVVRFLRLRR